jgi:hypothetical protein
MSQGTGSFARGFLAISWSNPRSLGSSARSVSGSLHLLPLPLLQLPGLWLYIPVGVNGTRQLPWCNLADQCQV